MYDIYGIVKVEYYSRYKGEYFVYISHIAFLLQRNPKMSIVYCGALDIYIYIYIYT